MCWLVDKTWPECGRTPTLCFPEGQQSGGCWSRVHGAFVMLDYHKWWGAMVHLRLLSHKDVIVIWLLLNWVKHNYWVYKWWNKSSFWWKLLNIKCKILFGNVYLNAMYRVFSLTSSFTQGQLSLIARKSCSPASVVFPSWGFFMQTLFIKISTWKWEVFYDVKTWLFEAFGVTEPKSRHNLS